MKKKVKNKIFKFEKNKLYLIYLKQMKRTTQEIIEEAKIVHGSLYDYSKFIYKNAAQNSIIICKDHGEFLQRPFNHINKKHGCPTCSKNKSKSIDDFIKQANIIHNFKFDYSKFIYINAKTKGIIICKEHGEFLQSADKHINRKQGCLKCAGNNRKTQEEFIEEANEIHKFTFDYSKFIYVNTMTKGIIICQYNHSFLQTPSCHLNGYGCPKCAGNNRKTQEEFIEEANEIHKFTFDYSKFIYVNTMTKGIIICSKHGEFSQSPDNHLHRKGCPKCTGSKTSLLLEDWFKKENIKFVSEFRVNGVNGNNAYFDYYLEDHNVFLELDGRHHFDQVRNWIDPIDQLRRDIYKMKTESKIIRIFQEDIWNKKFDFETLKEALNSKEKLICLPTTEIYKNHLFPWKVYSTRDILKEFEKLKKLSKSKMNSRTVIGNKCSDFFFQYIRLNTPNYNGNSAVDYFYNEREDIIKRAENKDLLKTVTWLNHSPAQFSVYISCFIYSKFNAKKVFDPYSGWGDRCLAAMACDIEYIGCDSNPDLKDSYEKMIQFYNSKKTTFINCKSEEIIDDLDLKDVDLVFSSPPFYKKNGRLTEQYTNTEMNYKKFMIDSLIPLFKKFLDKVTIVLYIPENMKKDLVEKNIYHKEEIKIDMKRNLYIY
jgi:very-short-patch-repair endonuclease